jgi:hypothetical protein
VLDKVGKGVSEFTWAARGTRADGSAWSLRRRDKIASEWYLSVETADKLWWDLYRLFNNGFEAITIDSVTMSGAVDPDFQQARLVGLEKLDANGRWQKVSRRTPLELVAGSEAFFRGVLRSVRTSRLTRVQLSFVVPRTVGATGSLKVSAGAGFFFDEPAGVDSFGELVQSIDEAPTGDTLRAELRATRRTPSGRQRITQEARATAPTALFGDLFFEARIVSTAA